MTALSRDLLGRAHGALAVSGGNGPCVGVLREILSAIEGDVPATTSPAAVLVSTMGQPTLMYVSADRVVNLGVIDPAELREWAQTNPVHLRFIQALLVHATLLVDEAINEDNL